MTCDQVRGLVAEGAPLPEEAEGHLAACPGCREVARRWAVVRRELAALREEPEPPFLHPRIMAAVRQAAATPLPWWRRVPRAAWASAGVAAVLVGVLATQGVLRQGGLAPAPTLEAKRETARVDEGGLPPGAAHPLDQQPPQEPRVPAPRGVEVERPAPAVPRPSLPGAGREDTPLAAIAEFAPPQDRDQEGEPPPAPLVVAKALAPAPREEGEVARLHPQPGPGAVGRVTAAAAGEGGAAVRLRAEGVFEQEPAAEAGHPASLPVALLSPSNDRVAVLTLEPAAAPPPSRVWVLILRDDGGVALDGPPAEMLAQLLPRWQRALAGLELPPGRYRVVRLTP